MQKNIQDFSAYIRQAYEKQLYIMEQSLIFLQF